MKSKLVIATSAIALAIGFAATPASATFPNGGHNSNPCCGVDWDFVDRDIDLDIQPDVFDLSGITSICADQLFIGEMNAEAIVKKANVELDLTNSATAAANMISVAGDTVNDETLPSSFPAVVEAVQSAYGKFYATAEVGSSHYFWGPKMEVGGDLTNSATAAANIISVDASGIAGVDATQKAGSLLFWNDIDLTATAEVSRVKVGGDLANSATAAANIVSVTVTETELDAGHVNPFGFGGHHHNHGVDTSLALVDVTQTAFAEMDATAKVYKVNVGGNLTNAATAAANVISVINK